MDGLFIFFAVLCLVVWFLGVPLIYTLKRHDIFVVALIRGLVNCVWLACLVDVCFDQEKFDNFRALNQGQWVAAGVQLMTNELKPELRVIQFVAVTLALTLSGMVFKETDWPYPTLVEFMVCLLVIPINWRISEQPLPRHPGSYAPLVILCVSFVAYMLTYQATYEGSYLIWQMGFMLSAIFIGLSKRQWAMGDDTSSVSSGSNSATPASTTELGDLSVATETTPLTPPR